MPTSQALNSRENLKEISKKHQTNIENVFGNSTENQEQIEINIQEISNKYIKNVVSLYIKTYDIL